MNVYYDLLCDSQLPDNQGYWWSQLFANQVRAGQVLPPPQQQQEPKKKSRGQHKLQRYRKKFRRQGLDEDTINKRISDISVDYQ
ncbi:unnamed protein product [Didymodactylos carnosus]|uniref:Uncharacterized protein n=2 Tax=Didymodactylos carnosus TaxID=1234261 RepID=A0A815YVD7_9BILA|nr:unnamed protein product [Didymodactylos carnosus]CAF4442025.1 unnamed protein product [Didymodactylos carnosus]